jgi:hypothetical protein
MVWGNHELAVYTLDGSAPAFGIGDNIAAYFDWTPTREPTPAGPTRPERDHATVRSLYRQLSLGPMADLILIDAPADYAASGPLDDRRMLEAAQMTWLLDTLGDSASRGVPWRVIVNQQPMGHTKMPLWCAPGDQNVVVEGGRVGRRSPPPLQQPGIRPELPHPVDGRIELRCDPQRARHRILVDSGDGHGVLLLGTEPGGASASSAARTAPKRSSRSRQATSKSSRRRCAEIARQRQEGQH